LHLLWSICCGAELNLQTFAAVQVHDLAAINDAILLLVIPAASCRDVSGSKALKLAQELDSDGQ